RALVLVCWFALRDAFDEGLNMLAQLGYGRRLAGCLQRRSHRCYRPRCTLGTFEHLNATQFPAEFGAAQHPRNGHQFTPDRFQLFLGTGRRQPVPFLGRAFLEGGKARHPTPLLLRTAISLSSAISSMAAQTADLRLSGPYSSSQHPWLIQVSGCLM